MKWKTAAEQSRKNAATRITKDGRITIRSLPDGDAIIQNEGNKAYRVAATKEIKGFNDWVPKI